MSAAEKRLSGPRRVDVVNREPALVALKINKPRRVHLDRENGRTRLELALDRLVNNLRLDDLFPTGYEHRSAVQIFCFQPYYFTDNIFVLET